MQKWTTSKFWKQISVVFVYLCIQILTSQTSKGSNSTQDIHLKTGESTSININKLEEVNISQKGMIDVDLSNKGHIYITGIKPGFTLLKVYSIDDYNKVHIYKVYVEANKKISSNDAIFKKMCLSTRLKCDYTLGIVSGESNDYKKFFAFKAFCQKHSKCSFFATLNENQRLLWASLIRGILSTHHQITDIRVSRLGLSHVKINCSTSHKVEDLASQAQKIIMGSYPSKAIHFQCAIAKEQWLLKIKIMLHVDQSADEIGFKPSYDLFTKDYNRILQKSLHSFDDFITSKNTKIISEPSLIIETGTLSKLNSGGSYLFIDGGINPSNGKIATSEYGIFLSAKIIKSSESGQQISYSISLKAPKSGSMTDLSHHNLSSTTTVPRNQQCLIGTVDFTSSHKTQNSLLIGSSIPILSPIFRFMQKDHSKSTISFWMSIASR